jgi:nitrite reductase/ring-hydroxylating ferredoxin subunit/uncharacterized membrane protein
MIDRKPFDRVPFELRRAVGRIEEAEALDAVASAVAPIVGRMTTSPMVKQVLSGAPFGHRLHPMLTDIPIGCWTSASVLDAIAWRSGDASARRLVGLGVVSAIPTAVTGLSDWHDISRKDRRIGVVHMAANGAATLIELASWSARRRGHHVRGALLGLLGIGVATVGGYLGGHLVFARRVGVDVEVPVVTDDGWHMACRAEELVEGESISATIDGVRIAVVLDRGRVYAMAAVCSHAGGPLDRGDVHDGVLVCPWHGSEFCLDDGSVVRGPAASPEPVYDTRLRGGLVEVRLVPAGSAPSESAVVPGAQRAPAVAATNAGSTSRS